MLTILVVDDEAAILSAIEAVLRHAGYTVCTAATPSSALQQFDRIRPDLVLLDIHLGDREPLDGLDLLRELRVRRPAVPVVMLSAYLDLVTRQIALDAGAQACWAKPISLPVLVERTAQVLGSAVPSPLAP